MVGKTEGVTTRISRRETVVTEAKGTTRTYRKSPGRPVTDKSPSRITRRVSKSPTRAPKARAKSPPKTRAKSPQQRTKSPQRRPISPQQMVTRKRSPGRPSKVVTPVTATAIPVPKPRQSPSRRKSITRRSPIKIETEKVVTKKVDTVELESDSDESEVSEISKKSSSYISKLRKSLSREPSVTASESTTKYSSFDRVVHLKNHYEPVVKLTEFSDEDELVVFEEPKKTKRASPQIRHVNLLMTILDLTLSLGFMITLLAICGDAVCTYRIPTINLLKQVLSYFDATAILYTSVFYGFIFALSAFPFCGKKCHAPLTRAGAFTYNMNGLFCAFITFTLLAVLEYNFTGHVFNFVFENVRKILVANLVLAFVFGILVYVRALRVPLSNLSGLALENTFLFNFVYGSEINPRLFGRIDIKTVLFRANCILGLIIWSTGLYHSINWTLSTIEGPFDIKNIYNSIHINSINHTVLALCAITIFLLLDALVFEYTWTSTAELQYESFGLMKCIEYCVLFNFTGLLPKCLLDDKNGEQIESWRIALALVIFGIGYVLFRASSLQKHSFRENPYSPRVAHLESIPSGGKKIICSSYWGFVRHPNYLGDIIMNFSYLILAYTNPLTILNFVGILKMFQRAHTDDTRCRKRYGPAWERYTQRVKHVLVPGVY